MLWQVQVRLQLGLLGTQLLRILSVFDVQPTSINLLLGILRPKLDKYGRVQLDLLNAPVATSFVLYFSTLWKHEQNTIYEYVQSKVIF